MLSFNILKRGRPVSKIKAIILSAGKGRRMKTDIPKQYLSVKGHPVIYYTLKSFQESNVDEIILVTGKDELEEVKRDIVDKYGFEKVKNIVSGGKERYDSVIQGLENVEDEDIVLVHDGARPLITVIEINKIIEEVKISGACIAAVPAKDTIKYVNENGEVEDTPDRAKMWLVQTPQGFYAKILKNAYGEMKRHDDETITDDSMVVEKYTDKRVKVVKTSYDNIKVTTPEDIVYMETVLQNRK